jgi:rod shape-determining protein MreC
MKDILPKGPLLLERPLRASANLFFVSKREYFTLIAAIVVSLYCLFNNDKPQIEAVRAFLLDRFALLQTKTGWVRNLFELNRENEALRWRATQMMLENIQLREALLENHRLRQMLELRERLPLHFRASRVIAKERDRTPVAVTIDVGEEDGIRPNMAVVTPEGLVGKIYKANRHTSIVQLMLDRNFSASARVQRSRVLGIVTWTESRGLELTAVPGHSDVKIGDAVVVSDSSALFPPGLRIGVVTETAEEKTTLFMRIRLEPDVDFSRLEEVFVTSNK